jgi:hypothetical protein
MSKKLIKKNGIPGKNGSTNPIIPIIKNESEVRIRKKEKI